MKKTDIPHASRRCGAKTRAGHPCKNWGMDNGRCRMHGGKSTGPQTPEGLERIRKASWKHGRYSQQIQRERRMMAAMARKLNKPTMELTMEELMMCAVLLRKLEDPSLPVDQ